MKNKKIDPINEHSGCSKQNQILAGENSKLKREVCKFQKLSTKLWLQHVKDRIDIRKMWKSGWKEGYKVKGEENRIEMTNSPLTPKMKTDLKLEEKLKILSSNSIFKQKRSIRDLLAELQILDKNK